MMMLMFVVFGQKTTKKDRREKAPAVNLPSSLGLRAFLDVSGHGHGYASWLHLPPVWWAACVVAFSLHFCWQDTTFVAVTAVCHFRELSIWHLLRNCFRVSPRHPLRLRLFLGALLVLRGRTVDCLSSAKSQPAPPCPTYVLGASSMRNRLPCEFPASEYEKCQLMLPSASHQPRNERCTSSSAMHLNSKV